jgi:hypothetical protein
LKPTATTHDYSLFIILRSYLLELWQKQIELITQKHGLITFIVHPDYIIEKRARDTYQTLLEYIARMRSDGKAWIALPQEVADWWRQRRQMKLVWDNGVWRIEGPGKKRARIAYAAVDGGKISCEIESSGKQAFDFG